MELPGGLFPTEVLGPLGKEEAQRVSGVVLALGPGNLFDGDNAAGFAVDAAHHIAEAHRDVPEGDEVEQTRRGHVTVDGAFASAARAHRLGVLARDDLDFDDWTEASADQADLLVNKGLDRVDNAE